MFKYPLKYLKTYDKKAYKIYKKTVRERSNYENRY